MPCPTAWHNVLVGRQFSRFPEEVEERPLDRAWFYGGLLAVEAEFVEAADGLPRSEPLIRES